jgi:PAS domain S-box-containing protein
MSAPLPGDEKRRLEALRGYEVLDTAPEQAFDDLTLLAAHICQVPTAMVSLVDQDRQWFKSKLGMTAAETSRDIAFCAHTILHANQVLEVRDAAADPRFASSPLVTTNPNIRFYAGAPLVTPSGFPLGALCVMDTIPRQLSAEQLTALQALSRRVVDQLELRRQTRELGQKERETAQLLVQAEKSRRALLSLVEDTQQAMARLKESEERFREMADSIDEVFWMTDTGKTRWLYISPAYEKIWGRRCSELYAQPDTWANAIVPEDRARIVAAATTKQITGDYQEEYRIQQPDGSVRWISDRAFPIKDAAGQVYRVVGVAVDITERKQMEEQFLRAQRMEAIGTLAGGVAHDLNNILAPVVMAAGLLKGTLTTSHDQSLLNMVEASAQRGAAIIRQLLMFSRGVAGERVIVQLRHLLKDMVGIMHETFPREIAVVENIPGDLWPVIGDATQLHQVLMNLCVNSRDAMPTGGQLTLRAENAELGEADARGHALAEAGRYAVLIVEDTGQGIPAAIIDRIFDPFFSTKEIGKGTGLGLSTVLGIVKNHKGFLTVQSEPGQGTAFRIYLPAEAGAIASVASPSATPMGGRGELILLVDDEEHVRKSTRLALEANNYQVVTGANGREALARLLENQDAIKLVITDLMMPVMSGLDLARALRGIKPGLKVIVTTGLDQDSKRTELAALGVTEILSKPFVATDLLGAVRRVLD